MCIVRASGFELVTLSLCNLTDRDAQPSKTSISIFLAYRGYRVTNVTIIADIEPPPALGLVDRSRVIALTIGSRRLVLLHKARASRMGGTMSLNHASRQHVQWNLDWAELLLRRERWAAVDVTNRSIEECVAEIVALRRWQTGSTR